MTQILHAGIFYRRLLLLATAVGVGAAAFIFMMADRAKSPNVILITVDTLRADHLGAYGYRRDTSPKLDAFAKESMVYRRAFALAPETNPSMSSLMTSHLPHETQVLRNFNVLPEQVTTLAEGLKTHGWKTSAIVSNYSLRRGSGFDQGFEEYDDRMDDPGESFGFAAVQRIAPKTSAAAVHWLRQHRDEHFFLWVHFMDPHVPYTPPPPYDTMFMDSAGEHRSLPVLSKESMRSGRNLRGIPYSAKLGEHTDIDYYVARYDGEIRFLDDSLGRLLEEVRTLGLLENSLLIITADHGEGMGEHDFYFNHTEFVYTGLIHVPLVLRLPGPARSGQSIDESVSLLDVFPTVMEVLKLPVPGAPIGRSLLDHPERPILAASAFSPGHRTLIQGRYALVMDGGGQSIPALYDLDQDFYETRDLLQNGNVGEFQTATAMIETFRRMAAEDALKVGPPIEWTILAEEKEKLRTLGYVQ